MSAGDWALVILAAFWGVLVLFLSLVMVNLFRVLESTKLLVDGIRTETVPLLGEVKTTVSSVNQEIGRVDTMLASLGNITKSVERVTAVVEHAVSNPLVKAIAFAAGAQKAFKRLGGEK